jgi:hypothetical protein
MTETDRTEVEYELLTFFFMITDFTARSAHAKAGRHRSDHVLENLLGLFPGPSFMSDEVRNFDSPCLAMAYESFIESLEAYYQKTGRPEAAGNLEPLELEDLTVSDIDAFELAGTLYDFKKLMDSRITERSRSRRAGKAYAEEPLPLHHLLNAMTVASLDGTTERYPVIKRLAEKTLKTLSIYSPGFPGTN